ncbi:DoxX family protein [Pseudarthrobacter sp. J1738]|uniref:DoxX family protein n=1 Tax=Pseudarthrobacter sp. J1738 TaxID=3420446 RepID=UPI003D2B5EB8
MNVFLWILQGLLAVLFVMAGTLKTIQAKEKLASKMGWVDNVSASTVRSIGAAEVLGGLGLILPAATGIATWLTPLAAAALAVVMILAAVTHYRRGEYPAIIFNVILALLCAVVAWGRFGPWAL